RGARAGGLLPGPGRGALAAPERSPPRGTKICGCCPEIYQAVTRRSIPKKFVIISTCFHCCFTLLKPSSCVFVQGLNNRRKNMLLL
ncbi:unnamed protein product, partial [Heterosigma akashiwo]